MLQLSQNTHLTLFKYTTENKGTRVVRRMSPYVPKHCKLDKWFYFVFSITLFFYNKLK